MVLWEVTIHEGVKLQALTVTKLKQGLRKLDHQMERMKRILPLLGCAYCCLKQSHTTI